MHWQRKGGMHGLELSIIILLGVCLSGCAGPKQIARPTVGELLSNVGEGMVGEIVFQASVLDKEQAGRLFENDMARKGVLPVLFVITNKSSADCHISREHFTAQMGPSRVEPAMPGRAAALLRNSSGSSGATMAGWLLLGVLAAPIINEADKSETSAIETHREVIFASADLPPGGKATGYLFFESPVPLTELKQLGVEFCLSGNRNESIAVQLKNPYATGK